MPSNPVARLAARLRKRFPGPKIRIKRGKLEEAFANCVFDPAKGIFIITLDKDRLDNDLCLFFLPHEVAHALSWGLDEEDHGDAFWAAYKKTYKVYEEFIHDHNKETP